LHGGTGARGDPALYVVATPLGNLQDVTLRALEVLRSVDLIAAEDTRVTRVLLDRHGISAQSFALHEHNEARAAQRVIALLQEGRSVALVSDAGTPAISDPGALLVRSVLDAGLRVLPIPGPSAVTALMSVAGFEAPAFLFAGFPPAQAAARRGMLEGLRDLPCVLVLYEAPHRVRDTLQELSQTLGAQRRLVIGRELTKLFETVQVLRLGEACAWLDADANRLKGEFVLAVGPGETPGDAQAQEGERVLALLLAELPVRQAVKLAADITGAKRNALYQRALELKGEGGSD
jgi:16S rRNA (cytidine1402-2'-O)-methyltransferase